MTGQRIKKSSVFLAFHNFLSLQLPVFFKELKLLGKSSKIDVFNGTKEVLKDILSGKEEASKKNPTT